MAATHSYRTLIFAPRRTRPSAPQHSLCMVSVSYYPERTFFMAFPLNTLALRRAPLNGLLLAGLLTMSGAAVLAQSAPAAAPAPGMHGDRMARHDPAKMQAMMAKHQAEMKAKLAITPAQEAAWSSYIAAMQPTGRGMQGNAEQRAELDKLPTPERIDKMRALRAQRMAEMNAAMDKRGDATKALYTALSQEQKKVFDAEHLKHRQHHGMHHHGGHDAKKS